MTDETKEIIGAVQEMFLDMKQEMKQEIGEIRLELAEVKQLATKTAMTLENETNKNVQLLAEGYLPLTEKVDTLTKDMEIVKFNVDIIKKVVTTHSKELDRLGKAR
ncbi:MAG: hypothetical protein HFE60_12580 [Anaerotignum sp.]|jgi:hypothetical protein|nr:hypothetical protein [Anaerotignum sp.]